MVDRVQHPKARDLVVQARRPLGNPWWPQRQSPLLARRQTPRGWRRRRSRFLPALRARPPNRAEHPRGPAPRASERSLEFSGQHRGEARHCRGLSRRQTGSGGILATTRLCRCRPRARRLLVWRGQTVGRGGRRSWRREFAWRAGGCRQGARPLPYPHVLPGTRPGLHRGSDALLQGARQARLAWDAEAEAPFRPLPADVFPIGGEQRFWGWSARGHDCPQGRRRIVRGVGGPLPSIPRRPRLVLRLGDGLGGSGGWGVGRWRKRAERPPPRTPTSSRDSGRAPSRNGGGAGAFA